MPLTLLQCKIKRRTYKATYNFTRYKNKFDTTNKNQENIGLIEIMLEKLNVTCSEYQDIQGQIKMFELSDLEIEDENLQHSAEERNEFEMSYFEIVGSIKRCIANIRQESNQSIASGDHSVVQVVSNSSSQSSVKLPEIKLPQFKGEFADWIHFRDYFDATIIKNKNIANIQKF